MSMTRRYSFPTGRWWSGAILPAFLLASGASVPAMAQVGLGRADSLINDGAIWTRVQRSAREASISPHWLKDGNRFWYSTARKGVTEVFLVDAKAGSQTPFFDLARLRPAIEAATGRPLTGTGVPFASFTLSDDEAKARFEIESRRFELDLFSYALRELAAGEGAATALSTPRKTGEDGISGSTYVGPDRLERLSLDGKRLTHIRDNNLWLRSAITNEMVQLTTDGRDGDAWENAAWSPTGRQLIVTRTDTKPVHKQPLVEWLSRDQHVRFLPFVQVGGPLPRVELYLMDPDNGKSRRIDTGQGANDYDTFVIPLRWRRGGSEFLFIRMTRDWKKLELRAADAVTGQSRIILTDEQSTFLSGTYLGNVASFLASTLDDDRHFIWRSQKDGWSHLYLYDFDGRLVRRLTSGRFPVMNVEAVDEKAGWVYFNARAEPRLYDTHLYRVPLRRNGAMTRLTAGQGVHSAQLSPSADYLVDSYSSPTTPPVVELRRVDGTLVRELGRTAIADIMPRDWAPPEEFVVKAADGVTDLHGLLYKPYDFDPGKRYPVVETIYAGVGEQAIPHIFADAVPDALLLQGGEKLNDALRRAGFVVFAVDGRGTPGRSKAFEDVVYGKLGQNEIPDHVAALKAVAATRPYMDMDRVGIAGPSYGGFFAIRALLQAPDIYKAAVARAPGGNRMDGPQGGTEPYMGTPGPANAEAYANASNEHLIPKMQGKLMLIVGTSDMNTPFYNIRYVDALANANKNYSLIVLPQAGHSTGKNPFVLENTLRFLTENLKDRTKQVP